MLLFGSFPTTGRKIPSETQVARAEAIERCIELVRKEEIKRIKAFGSIISGIPKGQEFSKKLRKLAAGPEVLIF